MGDTNRSSCTEKFLLVVLVSNVFAKATAPIAVPCSPVVGSCYCKIGTSFLLMQHRVFFLNTWWYRGFFSIKIFVCVTYGGSAIFVPYVGVETRH